ncbi:hypothetical protein FHW03_003305 [Ochrobactrum sp. RH2CCR150]|nr:hypothetical protein [Ochrobactrum sp. RH2CCR150]
MQIIFQQADPAAQPRARQPELSGSSRKATKFNDFYEEAQIIEIGHEGFFHCPVFRTD